MTSQQTWRLGPVVVVALSLGACTPWQARMEPYAGDIARNGSLAEREAFFAQLKAKRGGVITKSEDGQTVTVVGDVSLPQGQWEQYQSVAESVQYLFTPSSEGQTLQAVVIAVKPPRNTNYEFATVSPDGKEIMDEAVIGRCGADALEHMWSRKLSWPDKPTLFGLTRGKEGTVKVIVTDDLPWFMNHEHCETLDEVAARLDALRTSEKFDEWEKTHAAWIQGSEHMEHALRAPKWRMEEELQKRQRASESDADAAAELRADAVWTSPTLPGVLPTLLERADAAKKRGKARPADSARLSKFATLLETEIAKAIAEHRDATAAGYAALLGQASGKKLAELTVSEGVLGAFPVWPLEKGRVAAAKLAAAIVPLIPGTLDSAGGGRDEGLGDEQAMGWPLYTDLGVLCKNEADRTDKTGQVTLVLKIVEPVTGQLTAHSRKLTDTRRIGNTTEVNPDYARWQAKTIELNEKVQSLGGAGARLRADSNDSNAKYQQTNTYTQGGRLVTDTRETDQSLQNRSNAALGGLMARSELRSAESDLEEHLNKEPSKTHLVAPKTMAMYEEYTIEDQTWTGEFRRVVSLTGGGTERRLPQSYRVSESDRRTSASPSNPSVGTLRGESTVRRDAQNKMNDEFRQQLRLEQRKLVTDSLAAREKTLPATLTAEQRAEEAAWARYLFGLAAPGDAKMLPLTPEALRGALGK